MTRLDLTTVRALEERSFNAWPARQTVFFNGWLFRLAGGYTKRANSVNATNPGASFEGVRGAAETLYKRHGLPAVFRLSPLASPEADKDIVVDPTKRRRGHGRALTRALMCWGRDEGARSAYLQVREQNEPARRLYAELGFEDLYRYHYRVPPDPLP